jgi:hypothetical protein
MQSTMRKAKRSGMTAREVWDTISSGRMESAKTQGWRRSELVATLADDQRDLVLVYGKRATAGLFPEASP